jgi:hypothetical protein
MSAGADRATPAQAHYLGAVPPAWSAEQVLGLAPDAASASAGRKQASPAVWSGLGASERALWGLCQGSGNKPYQTVVDLGEPAFRCSCPSRKFPCKHALGLMLLWAADPGAPAAGDPPAWAGDWLAGREQRAERRARPAEPEDRERAQADAARRVERREARIEDGLAELRLWLDDLVRQGFAQAEQRARRDWEQMAARLVDAQAPGLARRVRSLAATIGTGRDWPARLLDQAALLSLLVDAYPRHEELEPGLRAELRTQIGWTTGADDLLTAGERVAGVWRCAGQALEIDERLAVRRTWLWEAALGRWALLLDFAHPSRPLPPAPAPGRSVRAELAFYPGAGSLRAQIAGQAGDDAGGAPLPAAASVAAIHAARARALAANPWTDRLPVALAATPVREDGAWLLADAGLDAVPLHPRSDRGLDLAALAGGRPLTIFGEWLGGGLLPLSAWQDDGDPVLL